MRALCWNGVGDLAVETVSEPRIVNPHDAIVRVILSSVCGSDLHLIDGYVPTMRKGDILGHEFIGEIMEVGPEVRTVRRGERVVVSSIVGCGECWFCQREEWSLCDNTNPNAWMLDKAHGHGGAGILGYSHAFGGYAGSHAEYVRVPFADRGTFPVPDSISDEQALFCSDAFPTGYMAAELAGIEPGDAVAVWGCGGVGQMAIRSAWLLGAGRVIAIDRVAERLEMAREHGAAETIDFERVDVLQTLDEMTGGRGPDRCIDAVGMEAASTGIENLYDKAKQAVRLHTGRPSVIRQAIMACRKGGTVAVVGVYFGMVDKFPLGPAMNKALTVRMGQMHGQRYILRLLEHVERGEADPSFLLTHRLRLEDGRHGYAMFKHKLDGCVRSVFAP